jgi:histone H2B
MAVRKHQGSGSKGAKGLKPTSIPKRIARKKKESFSLYIYKVLKETSGNKDSKGINKRAMNIMNSLVFDVFDQLATQAAQLLRTTGKHTLTAREVESCVKLLFPVDLAQHAIQEGRKAVEKFRNQD